MLLFICIIPAGIEIDWISFNTSHVAIYPTSPPQESSRHSFQYISCCYLSGGIHRRWKPEKTVSIHLMLLFINMCTAMRLRTGSFNTSHVAIYLISGCRWSCRISGFNTSHVAIYLQDLVYLDQFQESFNTSHVAIYQESTFIKP